jgi:hypothetical protein
MSLNKRIEIQLKDPLSQVTRNERRSLLGVSAIGIMIVKTGLIPSRISALGIEFSQTDQHSLLMAIAGVVLYFLLAFAIYSWSDLLAWKIAYYDMMVLDDIESRKNSSDEPKREETISWRKYKREILHKPIIKDPEVELAVALPFWYGLHGKVSVLRAIFEFLLPIAIGVYAIVLLVRTQV